MREIGSEFWDVPTADCRNHLFPDTAQWYLSGRGALKAILKDLEGCHTAAVPSWCCDSMIRPFLEAGMEVRFYPVYWERGLIQEPAFDCDVLLVMDYFGYTGPSFDRGGYKGIVIRDLTHSLFSAAYSDADYFFGSLRKWCGIWTGGFAWSADGRKLVPGTAGDHSYTALRERAMTLKNAYLFGSAEDDAPAGKEHLDVSGKRKTFWIWWKSFRPRRRI